MEGGERGERDAGHGQGRDARVLQGEEACSKGIHGLALCHQSRLLTLLLSTCRAYGTRRSKANTAKALSAPSKATVSATSSPIPYDAANFPRLSCRLSDSLDIVTILHTIFQHVLLARTVKNRNVAPFTTPILTGFVPPSARQKDRVPPSRGRRGDICSLCTCGYIAVCSIHVRILCRSISGTGIISTTGATPRATLRCFCACQARVPA